MVLQGALEVGISAHHIGFWKSIGVDLSDTHLGAMGFLAALLTLSQNIYGKQQLLNAVEKVKSR